MDETAIEMTPTERAALITVRLISGECLSNAQVADLCGYSERNSAYYLMMRLARVIPLAFCDGKWKLVDATEDMTITTNKYTSSRI